LRRAAGDEVARHIFWDGAAVAIFFGANKMPPKMPPKTSTKRPIAEPEVVNDVAHDGIVSEVVV
jgi:hypothetical protein